MRNILSPEALAVVLRNKSGVELPARKVRVTDQGGLKRDIAADAANQKPIKRLAHLLDRIRAIATVHDQLGDHRVIKHRDFAALVDAGIDPDATEMIIAVGRALQRERPLLETLHRRLIAHQSPCRWQEIAQWIFSIDPALNRPPTAPNVLLRERELLACRDPNHLLDQIQSGNAFGHRMLDLQPGVHFQKIEVLVLTDHKLNGARALILDGFGQCNRLRAHRLTGRFGDERRGCLFDDLLMATLNRTFTFVQIDNVAMGVAQDLDLDVPWLQHVLFDEHPIIAKAAQGLAATTGKSVVCFFVIECDPQPLSTPARAGFDHHRITNAPRDFNGLLGRVDRLVVSWDRADTRLIGEFFGGDFVAHRGD